MVPLRVSISAASQHSPPDLAWGLLVPDMPPVSAEERPGSHPAIPKWPYLLQPSMELSSEGIPVKLIFCHQVYSTSPPTGLKHDEGVLWLRAACDLEGDGGGASILPRSSSEGAVHGLALTLLSCYAPPVSPRSPELGLGKVWTHPGGESQGCQAGSHKGEDTCI